MCECNYKEKYQELLKKYQESVQTNKTLTIELIKISKENERYKMSLHNYVKYITEDS